MAAVTTTATSLIVLQDAGAEMNRAQHKTVKVQHRKEELPTPTQAQNSELS